MYNEMNQIQALEDILREIMQQLQRNQAQVVYMGSIQSLIKLQHQMFDLYQEIKGMVQMY